MLHNEFKKKLENVGKKVAVPLTGMTTALCLLSCNTTTLGERSAAVRESARQNPGGLADEYAKQEIREGWDTTIEEKLTFKVRKVSPRLYESGKQPKQAHEGAAHTQVELTDVAVTKKSIDRFTPTVRAAGDVLGRAAEGALVGHGIGNSGDTIIAEGGKAIAEGGRGGTGGTGGNPLSYVDNRYEPTINKDKPGHHHIEGN